MREFYTTIDEALLKGLRPETRIPRNLQFLHECLGFRIGKMAIEGIPFLYNPIPAALDIAYNWPFPQFLTGESWKILIVRNNILMADRVYSLSSSYVVTHIFDVDQLTFGKGTLMELADFGEYAIMANGVVMIHWDPTGPGWHAFRDHATLPVMGTVCNFKGQLIGGNITGIWNGATFDPWHDCDEKSIVWSAIGDVDFTPDRKNEAGYRRDPVGGEVYHVRRLGDDVIVYSSAGVTRMFPITSPAATFGFEELHDIGLKNKGAMNGNLKQHVFVDIEDNIWRVTAKGIEKLGYREYVEALNAAYGAGIDQSIIVTFDSDLQDFYISDGTSSLLLSANGLANYPSPVSAVWYDDEDAHGLCGLPETPDPPTHEPLLASHTIDMGYRAQKTIFSVELGTAGIIGAEVAVDWRMSTLDAFARTDFVPVNDEGVAPIIISGVDFRIVVKSEYFVRDVSELDYITARWKMTDLRGLRGVYAAPPRGQ